MGDDRRPDGFEDFTPAEYAWFEKHWTGANKDPRAQVTVPFPVNADVFVQQQFDWKTTEIRVGAGVTIRLWTEDVIPFLKMLTELAERAIRNAAVEAERMKEEETHVGYDEG